MLTLPDNAFCIAPWTSLTIAANGGVKPCCVFKGNFGRVQNGDTVHTVWNGEKMQNLRQKLATGQRVPGCSACWKREATVNTSRRFWYETQVGAGFSERENLSDLPPLDLRHMDLNFGNKCNLKCRMCGSWGSTNWFKDEKALSAIDPAYERGASPEALTPTILNPEIFRDLRPYLTNLERIDFKGGEPMMQEGMYTFLEYLIEWGLAPNITVAYTHNGTVTDERLKTLWPHFKKVRLVVSIEGLDDLYRYIRGGDHHSLEEVEQNLWFYDSFENLSGSYNVTVQTYNAFDLAKIVDWIATRPYQRFDKVYRFDCIVTSPPYLDINILPDDLRAEAIRTMEGSPHACLNPLRDALSRDVFSPEERERLLGLFVRFTKDLDRLRDQDLLSIRPIFKPLFEKYS